MMGKRDLVHRQKRQFKRDLDIFYEGQHTTVRKYDENARFFFSFWIFFMRDNGNPVAVSAPCGCLSRLGHGLGLVQLTTTN